MCKFTFASGAFSGKAWIVASKPDGDAILLDSISYTLPFPHVTMPVECINQELVRRAFSKADVNSTLLVEALAVLCRNKSTIDIAAEHPVMIVFAYCCGFLPWGFLVLLDFISAKWKTVRDTRRSGYYHQLAAVVPMLVVVVYAAMQGLSGDFKEMMTAISAVLLTIYHFGRTAWGLAQLNAYRSWCEETYQCLRVFSKGNEPDCVDLDAMLLVNNEIVDNEISGHDVSVKLDSKSGKMKILNPEVCTVRWAGAFLCSLAHVWESEFQESNVGKLCFWFLSHTTLLVSGKRSNSTLISIRQNLMDWNDTGAKCGAFGSIFVPFSPGFSPSSSPSMEPFEFELQNLVSSYPTGSGAELNVTVLKNRQAAFMGHVELVLMAKSMGHATLASLANSYSQTKFEFAVEEKKSWELYCTQIGLGEDQQGQLDHLHSFWKLYLIPPWSTKPNRRVLQASAHVDVVSAIIMGSVYEERVPSDEPFRQRMNVDVFDSYYRMVTEMEGYSGGTWTFLGIALDAVRTDIAEWVLTMPNQSSGLTWNPKLPSSAFVFAVSDYIAGFEYHRHISEDYLNVRIVWECQNALQASANVSSVNPNVLASAELVMLFLCGYPRLSVTKLWHRSYTIRFEIGPVHAPQDIKLLFDLDLVSGNASLSLSGDGHFDWEIWINAATGVMQGQRELSEERGKKQERTQRPPGHSIMRADLTRPMVTLRPPNENIHAWMGWPVFDPCVCQFERDQWLVSRGPITDEDQMASVLSEAEASLKDTVMNDYFLLELKPEV